MGMFDYVDPQYPLPDFPLDQSKVEFQTKSFGDGFTGGAMEKYTITKEGTLVYHKVRYELVPEEERPYYGKPEWDKNPIYQLMGCMKSVPVSDDVIPYHGMLNIYAVVGNTISGTWYEYNIKFTDGKVADIEKIYREFGV